MTGERNEVWRRLLTGADPAPRRRRALYRSIPSDPRCAQCFSPFGGIGGIVMRARGRGPWPNNPRYCTACFQTLERNPGGAEVEATFLFADVRGSTSLAEEMSAAAFSALMNRFFEVTTKIVIDTDGVVEKLIGDEVAAMYIPGFAGPEHAWVAVDAARTLVAATRGRAQTPWLPIGVGVHTGSAYIGNVGGQNGVTQFSALGDTVNTTARLASAAAAGEILVSDAATVASRLPIAGLERRELALKGKSQPVTVHVVRIY